MNINEWTLKHPQAAAELRAILLPMCDSVGDATSGEAGVQVAIRLEASRAGARLWRNNIGAGKLDNGAFLRWGLANDSAAVNMNIKSADLIGIRPVLITPGHVGQTIGQFVSRECKYPGWKYGGSEREQAQLRWAELVATFGGDAAFATGTGTL